MMFGNAARISQRKSFSATCATPLTVTALVFVLIFNSSAGAQSGRSRTVSGQQRPAESPRQTRTPGVNLPPPPPPPPLSVAKPTPTVAPVPAPSDVLPPATPASSDSSDSAETDMGDDEIIDVRSNLVPVSASVVDAKGAPLLNLGALISSCLLTAYANLSLMFRAPNRPFK
jgi:hypothetical protein